MQKKRLCACKLLMMVAVPLLGNRIPRCWKQFCPLCLLQHKSFSTTSQRPSSRLSYSGKAAYGKTTQTRKGRETGTEILVIPCKYASCGFDIFDSLTNFKMLLKGDNQLMKLVFHGKFLNNQLYHGHVYKFVQLLCTTVNSH